MQVRLEKIRLDDIFACALCGYCVSPCPIYSIMGWESYTPRGRLYLFKKIGSKGISKNELKGRKEKILKDYVNRLYNCSLCGRCEYVCHLKLNLLELWQDIRKMIVELGLAPEVVYQLEEAILQNKNIYGLDNTMRKDWALYTGIDLPQRDKAKIVYFVGCVTSFSGRIQNVAYALSSVLDHIGEEWVVLDEEWCCGHPLLLGGAIKRYREIAEHNVREISKLGAKVLVTGCPGCYLAFKEEYPRILGFKLPFEVFHSSELFAYYLRKNKLDIADLGYKLAYHDPCELARIGEVIDEPRLILSRLGNYYVPKESGLNTRCCGGGGLLKAINPDLSIKVADVRMNQLTNLKPDVIVTACPSCELNLKETEAAKKVNVIDLVELIAESLGIM